MSAETKQLYMTQVFNIKEAIEASQLSSNTLKNEDAIDSILLQKIKKKFGNRCNALGYVDNDSIKIVSRSMGIINSSQFNGNINYDIKVEAAICKPSVSNKLVCKVIGKNKIGLFAVSGPLHIIIASAHHKDTDVLGEIETGSEIEVEIINYKFKLNSSNIKVIAQYLRTI